MDVDLTTWLRFLHVLSAFGLIAGIVGRNLAMGQALRAQALEDLNSSVHLAGRFDKLLVVPGSFVVLALGLITAWRQSWPIWGSLEGGASDWLFVSLLLYLSVMFLVPTVLIPRGKTFDRAYQASIIEGRFTEHLKAAMSDRVVHAAHLYEAVAGLLIVFLMVAKPF